jgi:hypothetical protein
MIVSFAALSLNKKLGLLLGILGLGALVLGDPYQGAGVTIDTKELGRIVETEIDHVSVEDLADWIIQGKTDFRLLDLQSEADFTNYHIPGAENVPISALSDYGLLRNEKIILYSGGGIHSAQAWLLMKARNYKGIYMLRGGLDEWKEKILFPRPAATSSAEQAASFEKMKEVSKFFGGVPQTATAEQPAAGITIPKLEMPSAPAGGNPPGGSTKKKKEGC